MRRRFLAKKSLKRLSLGNISQIFATTGLPRWHVVNRSTLKGVESRRSNLGPEFGFIPRKRGCMPLYSSAHLLRIKDPETDCACSSSQTARHRQTRVEVGWVRCFHIFMPHLLQPSQWSGVHSSFARNASRRTGPSIARCTSP